MLSMIVCMGKNHEIGQDNDMPWGRGLPADLQYFKEITSGYDVVMGRKTFDSILTSLGKPLPNRTHHVITRDQSFQYEGVHVYSNIEGCLNHFTNQSLFVIGGATMYNQWLPYADRLYITKINEAFQADTFFPSLIEEEWALVSMKQGIKDEKNRYEHAFFVYDRKK